MFPVDYYLLVLGHSGVVELTLARPANEGLPVNDVLVVSRCGEVMAAAIALVDMPALSLAL